MEWYECCSFPLDQMRLEEIHTCPYCKKKYHCITTEQMPGFRDTEEEKCPYCGKVVRESMDYEFSTYELEEKYNG